MLVLLQKLLLTNTVASNTMTSASDVPETAENKGLVRVIITSATFPFSMLPSMTTFLPEDGRFTLMASSQPESIASKAILTKKYFFIYGLHILL